MSNLSNSTPTCGRVMTYEQALGPFDGNSTRRLLENIAARKYWKVAEDFSDGRRFDLPELQAKKAALILQELDAQIAQLPATADPLDKQVQVMMLLFNADQKFSESVTKPFQQSPKAEPKVTEREVIEPSEPTDEPLSGDQKLLQAKALTRGLL